MAARRTHRRSAPPASSPDDSKGKPLGIRVPTRLNDQLEAIAQREGNGVSAVVRRLLNDALTREVGGA